MFRILPIAAAVLGVTAAGLVLAATLSSQPAAALTNCSVTHDALDAVELEALTLINAERAKVGVTPLIASATLNGAAAWMSQDVSDNNYWAHQPDSLGRSFGERMRDCGVGGTSGENLAMGSASAAPIVSGWMGSPMHQANMLNGGFSYAGVGYYGGIWTLVLSSSAGSGGSLPTVTIPGFTPTNTATSTPTPTSTATPTPTATPTTFGPTLTPAAGPVRAIAAMVAWE